MSLSFIPTQKAVLTRLRSDIIVTSLLNQEKNTKGIYDYVTKDTAFPYVVVSDPVVNAFSVKNSDVEDIKVTLHIWTAEKSNSKAYNILTAIHDVFKYKLDVTGYTVLKTSYEDARVFTDIDGIHQHGVFTLKLSLRKGDNHS